MLSVSPLSLIPQPAMAQNDIAIVNEPDAADDLRSAIKRIGQRPTDSNALYDAGSASLRLGDPVVAMDFFLRAERIAPASGKIKAGLASAQLNLENPVEALRLFDIALALGANPVDLAIDRGLAFDLVGEFARAQQEYDLAAKYTASNKLIIRRAISYSLAGDINQSDALLLPLLRANDPLAWRARSFLLAAQGKVKESYKIAQGFLPENDAKNLRPYLKSMKKLTAAQQVAAVHFGQFPDKGAIGKDREDIRIASANKSSNAVVTDRLIPVGRALGTKKTEAKIVEETKVEPKIVSLTPTKAVKTAEVKTPNIISPKPIEAANNPRLAVVTDNNAQTKPSANNGKVAALPKQSSQGLISVKDAIQKSDERSFADAAVTQKTELNLDDFIAAIEIPEEDKKPATAVDLDSIKAEQAAKREAEKREADRRRAAKLEADRKEALRKEAAAKKKEDETKKAETAKNKSRYWVQIATGRDVKALKFDYRRISRKQAELFKGKTASTSKWGRTNRLVVGPFKDLKEAKSFEAQYRKGGGDGFVWRSGNDTVVTAIQ